MANVDKIADGSLAKKEEHRDEVSNLSEETARPESAEHEDLMSEKKSQSADAAPTEKEFAELLSETEALSLYVGRHGNVLKEAGMAIYQELLNAQSEATKIQSTATWAQLMRAYANMSAITYRDIGVNGRTILDTNAPRKQSFWARAASPRRRPLYIGLLLFAFALVFEFAARWAGGISDPSSLNGFSFVSYNVVDSLAAFLIPATWGGIGSCIFLMKRLSDKLFDLAYEEARLKGDGTRIFLGAMLGVIVVVLFFPDFSEKIQVGEVSFGPATAAFLAGLSVKPVYAAFETLSNGLADNISGRKQGDGK